MRILALAVSGALMVLGAISCQTETSKNEAAKAEVATLIQNSETFKLPASFVQLSLGKFLASDYEPRTSVRSKEMEALARVGIINMDYTAVSDHRWDTVTISLTRKGEIESGSWEKGTEFSSTFGPVKNWKVPIGQFKLTEINHFVQENGQTADVKFTFEIAPNKLGDTVGDLTHEVDDKKYVSRLTLEKRGGKWYLAEKGLQDSMRLAFASKAQN